MISEGLLKEVLNFPSISNIDVQSNIIVFRDSSLYDCKPTIKVNIYELAHKCKEYILSQPYIDSINIELDGQCYIEVIGLCSKSDEGGCLLLSTPSMDTELEALEVVCEWILKQKDK